MEKIKRAGENEAKQALIAILVCWGGIWILFEGINAMTEYTDKVLRYGVPVIWEREVFYVLIMFTGGLICLWAIKMMWSIRMRRNKERDGWGDFFKELCS